MNYETKEQLIKRAKSLGWRVGIFAVVSALAFVSDNIGLLDLNPTVVTLVSLTIGEVTKYLNSQSTTI